MERLSTKWHNPNWGEPDFKCPHCSEGWDDDGITDSEYGYFIPEEGEDSYIVVCEERIGIKETIGCGQKFVVKRTVRIEVKYDIKVQCCG